MRVAVGSDHAGFNLKEAIKKDLIEKGYEVVDVGTHSPERADYPVYAKLCAKEVINGNCQFGILCCGTGEGISITANKVKGIRCGIGYDDEVTALCRKHNDANMIAFGERFMKPEDAIRRANIFLTSDFEGGRHAARVAMMEEK